MSHSEERDLKQRTELADVRSTFDVLDTDDVLKHLFEGLPEYVVLLNPTRQIVYANRTVRDFARQERKAEYLGLRPGELFACQHAKAASFGCGTAEPCSRCSALESILVALDGDKASGECRILRDLSAGVTPLDLRVWGSPFLHGTDRYALLVAADITNEKRLKLMERIFLHDVMDMAGALDGLLMLLEEGDVAYLDVQHDLKEAAQMIIHEIQQQRLLKEAEQNTLVVHSELFDPLDLLEHLISLHRRGAAVNQKRFVICSDNKKSMVKSDKSLVVRVLTNMIKNALEASPQGETITLRCMVDETLVFECHNRGSIPPEVQAQLFSRSFSTKGAGRGLGTYSMKLLTERYLKGLVTFISSEQGGTTFTITLPRNLK